MIKLLFLLSIFWGSDCRESYLDKVLNSEMYNGYFLVVKTNINGRHAEVAVVNYRLYKFLKLETPELSNKERYVQYMKEQIYGGKEIDFSEGDLEIMDAAVIEKDKEVLSHATAAENGIFDTYFYVSEKYNYAQINSNLTAAQRGTIMKCLFESNYLMKVEEGSLTVVEKNFFEINKK